MTSLRGSQVKHRRRVLTGVYELGKEDDSLVETQLAPSANQQHNNRILLEGDNFPERLFGCSTHHLFPHSYGINLATDVFPEMNPTINKLHTNDDLMKSDATENDLLIYFMHSCPDLDPRNFPGKTIVVTGESKLGIPCAPNQEQWGKHCDKDMPVGPRIFWVGPHHNAQNIVQTHWGILLLNARARPIEGTIAHPEFQYLFDHALKPKNTGEFFLIYAASHCVPFREDAFDLLATKIGKEVHYNGNCRGSELMDDQKSISPYQLTHELGAYNNKELFQHYRFALVMENSFPDSATVTEKIFNAYLGGAIPIYFGSLEVMGIFNPKSFIWFDPTNPQLAIDLITELENDSNLYNEYLNAPILKDGERTIERYFSLRDEIGRGYLKRRIRSMVGIESTMYHYTLLNEERIQIQQYKLR